MEYTQLSVGITILEEHSRNCKLYRNFDVSSILVSSANALGECIDDFVLGKLICGKTHQGEKFILRG